MPEVSGLLNTTTYWSPLHFVVVPPEDPHSTTVTTLNGIEYPVGVDIEVDTVGFHELVVVTTSPDNKPPSVQTYVFSVIDQIRGDTEWSLAPWTPPAITMPDPAVFVGATLRVILPHAHTAGLAVPVIMYVETDVDDPERRHVVREHAVASVSSSSFVGEPDAPWRAAAGGEEATSGEPHQVEEAQLKRGVGATRLFPSSSTGTTLVEGSSDNVNVDVEIRLLPFELRVRSRSVGVPLPLQACAAAASAASTLGVPDEQWEELGHAYKALRCDVAGSVDWLILPPVVRGAVSLASGRFAVAPWGLQVQSAAVLTLQSSCTLLVGEGRRIVLANGAGLRLHGAAEQPITVDVLPSRSAAGRSGKQYWGGVVLKGRESFVEASGTFLLHSGGQQQQQQGGGVWGDGRVWGGVSDDPADLNENEGLGHRRERPLFAARHGGRLLLRDCYLVWGAGQAFILQGASLEASRIVVTSFVSGGQLSDCHVSIHGSHFADFPSDDVTYDDGDSDALYIAGGQASLTRSTFMSAKDDCVDSGTGGGGWLRIWGCVLERCFHEGLALSNNGPLPRWVVVEETVVSGCQQGVEMGFSTPLLRVLVAHCLLRDNGVQLRVGDNYGWPTEGVIWVRDSVLLPTVAPQQQQQQQQRAVLNRWRGSCGALPDRLVLDHCLLPSDPSAELGASAHELAGLRCNLWPSDPSLPMVVVGRDGQLASGSLGFGAGSDGMSMGVTGRDMHPPPLESVVGSWGEVSTGNAAGPGPGFRAKGDELLTLSLALWGGLHDRGHIQDVALRLHKGTPLLWSVAELCAALPPPLDAPASASPAPGPVPATCSVEQFRSALLSLHAYAAADGSPLHKLLLPATCPVREAGASPIGDGGSSFSGSGDASRDPQVKSRTPGDLLSFTTEPRAIPSPTSSSRPPPELHSLIIWSSVTPGERRAAADLLRRLLGSGPDSGDGEEVADDDEESGDAFFAPLRILKVWTVQPAGGGGLDEEWYSSFYAHNYYTIFETTPTGDRRRVPMTEHKGTGAFILAVVKDFRPRYAPRDGKGPVNLRLYALKRRLRALTSRAFQVHTSQTASEGSEDFRFLFGLSSEALPHLLHPPLPPPPPHREPGLSFEEGFKVGEAVLVRSLGAVMGGDASGEPATGEGRHATLVAVRVRAEEVTAVILRGEWPQYNLDVPQMRRDLDPVVNTPDLDDDMQNLQRAALMAHSRIALLLQLPKDTRWYRVSFSTEGKAIVPDDGSEVRSSIGPSPLLRWLGSLHTLKENAWRNELPACATAGQAWLALRADALQAERRLAAAVEGREDNIGDSNASQSELETMQKKQRSWDEEWGRLDQSEVDGGIRLGERPHLSKVVGQRAVAQQLSRVLVLVADRLEGPYTLWDGNHRCITFYSLLEDAVAAAAVPPTVAPAGGTASSPEKEFLDVYIGVSAMLTKPYKGSFYCSERDRVANV